MAAGYTVLATRYRPRTFIDVVGQEDSARVLQRAIATGRVPHAWLFSGPRGVGKTSMARILAKALDCLENEVGEPCGTCRVCRGIDESGDALDVVEIDGASHNKVENVRDLIENLRFRPAEARYRIYIVDEVHMLSTSAFNALLKTLEEPPAHAKFILCTTEPLKVPETIRSRCQQFDFRRLTSAQIRDRLVFICEQEGVPVPAGLLEAVARDAQGGLRDALSLLDQLISFGDGKPTREDYERLTGKLSPEVLHGLVSAALAGDTAGALGAAEQALQRGARAGDLLAQLTELLEGVLVVVAGGRPGDRADEELAGLTALGERTNLDHVMAMLDVLVEASRRLKQRHDARLVVEMAVLTLARLPLLQPVGEWLAEGARAAPGTGAPTRPAAPQAPAATRSQTAGSQTAGAPASSADRRAAAPARSQAPATKPGAPSPPAARGPAAAAPVPGPAPTPAPVATPAPAPAGDFAAGFLELLGKASRSLRMELSSYRHIAVSGDELLLTPPSGGASGLYELDRAAFTQKVEVAASQVAGRKLKLRMVAEGEVPSTSGEASRPAPRSESRPASGAAGGGGDRPAVERDILDAWPGAERVDM